MKRTCSIGRALAALVPAFAAACGTARGPGVPETPRLYRGDPTGAVSAVDFTRIPRNGAARVEEVLQGRVAGLQVARLPNGELSLRIRGTTSVLGSNEPLLVLDDQIIAPSQVSSALAMLSPHDVLRVEVLKDAGSTAFYGSRGANGVIIVTTRRGPD